MAALSIRCPISPEEVDEYIEKLISHKMVERDPVTQKFIPLADLRAVRLNKVEMIELLLVSGFLKIDGDRFSIKGSYRTLPPDFSIPKAIKENLKKSSSTKNINAKDKSSEWKTLRESSEKLRKVCPKVKPRNLTEKKGWKKLPKKVMKLDDEKKSKKGGKLEKINLRKRKPVRK